MPLYKISKETNNLEAVNPRTFEQVEIRERKHLQALLRENIGVLGDDILLIGEEFSSWTDSQRRVDLLANDRDANLVVIELKCIEDGGHMELQAIRYAAMLAPMDFETVVQTFENFRRKTNLNSMPADARSTLLNFLGVDTAEDVTISRAPKILLVSPTFSKEIKTTVLWLNERGLDIRCMEARPYEIENELFLTLEQIIPLPSASEYIVTLGKKARQTEQTISNRRTKTTMKILVENEILIPGTRLVLLRVPRAGLQITNDKAKKATFLAEREIQWDFDQSIYSLSNLCKAICQHFGGDVGSGAFAGPDFWAIEGQNKSLSEMARDIIFASPER